MSCHVGPRLTSDTGATYDQSKVYRGQDIEPQVTWGTNPGQVLSISDRIPDPAEFVDDAERKSTTSALHYMGLAAKTPIHDIPVERVFIG